MDFISYNGIPLNVLIQSLVHERAPQHDKSHTTYECTKWVVSALVTYNPGAISFNPQLSGKKPGPAAGFMPPQTDNAIRAFLEEPRGQLIVRSGYAAGLTMTQLMDPTQDTRSLVLVSPQQLNSRAFANSDVRNGPFCKVNSIHQIPGERLWKIHLAFETYVNESPGVRGIKRAQNLILSNRWSVHSDVNWQHLTTRVYQGICTVDGGLVRNAALNPSQFIDGLRAQFAGFSVPRGFQRTFVKVLCTPDGNNAVYVVRDEEQLYNKPRGRNAPRIEVQDTNFASQGSWGRFALQAYTNFVSDAPSIIATSAPLGPLAPLGVAYGAGNIAAKAAVANLPKYMRNVVVRVWGNRLVDRAYLVTNGLAVAAKRMYGDAQTFLLSTTTSEIIVSGDSNQLVTINWTENWGVDKGLGTFGNLILSGVQLLSPGAGGGPGVLSWRDALGLDLFANTGDTPIVPNRGAGAGNDNPPFPNLAGANGPSSGTAGTSIGAGIAPLITQVLEGFATAPSQVP